MFDIWLVVTSRLKLPFLYLQAILDKAHVSGPGLDARFIEGRALSRVGHFQSKMAQVLRFLHYFGTLDKK